jgi:hypothetical protein
VDENRLEGAKEAVISGHFGIGASNDNLLTVHDGAFHPGKGVFLHHTVSVYKEQYFALTVLRADIPGL